MAIPVQMLPILTPDQLGSSANLLQNALQKFTNMVNASYLPKEKSASLQKSIADALIAQAQADYAKPMTEAKLATEQTQPDYNRSLTQHTIADTNRMNTMTPLEATKQSILNKFLPQKEAADIEETKQRGKYYGMGGYGMSTGSKDESLFKNLVQSDNPKLNPDQAREAANALIEGRTTLSDGTPINPMSPDTKRAFDRAFKSTTTSKLITAGAQANQAHAELDAMNRIVIPIMKETGTTYGNKSLDQIRLSFSNKKEDQEKLGRIIGARSLQYAIAQLRNRIDMGEPGINATKELMDNSGQIIDIIAPRLTSEARLAAMDIINKGATEALKARNKYGVGASSAVGLPENQQNSSSPKGQERQVIDGQPVVKINGRWYHED